ncbi:MAG: hypothetical protein PHP75_02520, partial [Methylacidiphilaceae bacterium]|nr:hypothetical protein [Candidatus Methylacidiphilaceae bacterium]
IWTGLGPAPIVIGGASVDPSFPNRVRLGGEAKTAEVLAVLEGVRERLGKKTGVELVYNLAIVGEKEQS